MFLGIPAEPKPGESMSFGTPVPLGRTGISVGRLGLASSYRAPAPAYLEAFEAGCNYFTWGSFIRGRSKALAEALRDLFTRGDRDRVVLSMLSYAHTAFLTEAFLRRGLKQLGTDYADVLLLGYFSKRPPQRILDGALKLKQAGMVRAIARLNPEGPPSSARPRDGASGMLAVRRGAVPLALTVAWERRDVDHIRPVHQLSPQDQPSQDSVLP
jgi:hypothetical protein